MFSADPRAGGWTGAERADREEFIASPGSQNSTYVGASIFGQVEDKKENFIFNKKLYFVILGYSIKYSDLRTSI